MEEAARKYQGRAEFLMVYTREPHPGGVESFKLQSGHRKWRPTPQATTMEERVRTARWFKDYMQQERRVVADGFDDESMQRFFGNRLDPTIVIDLDGRIALKLAWTNGKLLEQFLDTFLARGGRFDETLALLTPFLGESPFVRLVLAKRVWKADRQAKIVLSNLIDLLSGNVQPAPGSPRLSATGEIALRNFGRRARREAAEVLAEMGPAAKDAVPALRAALEDEDEDLRRAAAAALERIEPGLLVRP